MAYGKLGQSEDPPFTFKVMLVQAYWPGATAREMEQLVAKRIEKALLESPHVETVKSFSRPGETKIFVMALDSTPAQRHARHVLPGPQTRAGYSAHPATRGARDHTLTTNSARISVTSSP